MDYIEMALTVEEQNEEEFRYYMAQQAEDAGMDELAAQERDAEES